MEISTSLENDLKKAIDKPLYHSLSKTLSEHHINSFLVGGLVRDLILNRPCKDIDIVVIGSGMNAAELCANALNVKKVNYFKNYGTAMFNYQDYDIEFVGARKESYQHDSRNPVVEEGSLEDDQNRRDFTINALALSLNKEDFGALLDPFDGVQHLRQELIKTPLDPAVTFSDDPLRMMRAIRFATQLNFTIDKKTLRAIKEQAHRIDIISKERVSDELNKIISAKKPSIGFELLFDTGLLAHVFPEMQALQGVEVKNGMSHKDNFYHTLEVLDNVADRSDNVWLRWSAILHDIAKPPTKRFHPKQGWTFHGHEDLGARMVPKIFRKMRLPQDQKMKYVQKMVFLHLRPIALTKETITDSAIRRLIFEAGDDIEDLMKLCESDITSKNERKVKTYLKRFQEVRQKIKDVEERDRIRNWQPPVSGELIMRTFDMKPCRKIGDIKTAIKEAILDGEIPNNYESAYKFMLKKGIELGLTPVKE